MPPPKPPLQPTLPLLFSLALVGSVAYAATPPAAPTRQLIAVNGRIQDLVCRDLDGDGRLDLLVSVTAGSKGNTTRRIQLYMQDDLGRFGLDGAANQELTPDERCVVFSVADLLPTPGKELLEIGTHQVTARVLGKSGLYGAASTVVSEERCFFLAPDSRRLPFWKTVIEVDKPGGPQAVILPEESGYALLMPGSSPTRFPLDPASGVTAEAETTTTSPAGLVLRVRSQLERAIACSLQTANRTEAIRIGDQILTLDATGKVTATQLPEPPPTPGAGDLARPQVLFRDLDADSHLDLVALYRLGLGADAALGANTRGGGHCVVRLFNGGDSPEPEAQTLASHLRLDGVGVRLRFADVDRDGSLDLVVTTYDPGMVASLARTFFDEIGIEVRAFRFDRRRRALETEPWTEIDLSVDEDDALMRAGDVDCGLLGPDFNGDGLSDFLYFERRRIEVWPGRMERTGLFGWFGDERHEIDDGNPLIEIELKSDLLTPPIAVDLDGDGRHDLVAVTRHELVVARADSGSGR